MVVKPKIKVLIGVLFAVLVILHFIWTVRSAYVDGYNEKWACELEGSNCTPEVRDELGTLAANDVATTYLTLIVSFLICVFLWFWFFGFVSKEVKSKNRFLMKFEKFSPLVKGLIYGILMTLMLLALYFLYLSGLASHSTLPGIVILLFFAVPILLAVLLMFVVSFLPHLGEKLLIVVFVPLANVFVGYVFAKIKSRKHLKITLAVYLFLNFIIAIFVTLILSG